MSSPERFSIPLLVDLVPGGIKAGTIFEVEYDPSSQWFSVATTIAARYLQAGGRVGYAASRRPEDVKHDLASLGVDVPATQKDGRLLVDDWYSATLTGGRLESASAQTGIFEPIEGGIRVRSLKVADLSVEWLKWSKHGFEAYDVAETWPPGALAIGESVSEMLRFNEENAFAEWVLSRTNPNDRRAKRIGLYGLIRGIHSESFYRRMENAADGVIELRVMERGEKIMSFLRITSLKGQPHNSSWHQIEIKPNGEAILAT